MPARAEAVSTIATRDLLERYVDEEYLAQHSFHPKMEDFYVTRIEDFRASISLPTHPHRRHVHVFVFLTAGEMTMTADLQLVRTGAGEAHLALAAQVVVVEGMSRDIRGFYCHFSPETLIQLYHKEQMAAELATIAGTLRAEAVALRGKAAAAVHATLERLLEAHGGTNNLRLVDAYLVTLCFELKAATDARSAAREAQSRAYAVTEDFKSLVRQHAGENNPMSFYAAHLCITPNHLNKCVREATGAPASVLLAQMRTLEAKVLLRHTTLSVAEIAYKLGFSDPSYFSRAFRAGTGLAPGAYRQAGD